MMMMIFACISFLSIVAFRKIWYFITKVAENIYFLNSKTKPGLTSVNVLKISQNDNRLQLINTIIFDYGKIFTYPSFLPLFFSFLR